MKTDHKKLLRRVLGALLMAGAGAFSNGCSGDDNNATTGGIIVPGGDGGSTASTAGAGGAGGAADTTSGTAGSGMAGGSGGNGGGSGGGSGSSGGGNGGAGGAGGGATCPANGPGAFNNATRLQGLLGPDGGLPPL